MIIEKTNTQLTLDASSLIIRATALENSTLAYNSTLGRAGLEDASGANRDIFIEDSSLFLKQDDIWWEVACASLVL